MSNLIRFRPRASLCAEARVTAFVDLARDRLTDVLVLDTHYRAHSWDVTAAFTVKGSKGEHWLHFLSGAVVGRKGRASGTPLATPFLDFAKACLRYRHASAPVSYNATHKRLRALCRVEEGFRSLGRTPEICTLDASVLDRAMELMAGASDRERYSLGNQIEGLLDFCRDLKLLASDFPWGCQVPKPKDVGGRIGKEFAERRAKRLPSAAAFEALGHVFHSPQNEADRVLSAITAICCGIPIRAHEVLQLPFDCEVEAVIPKGGDAGTQAAPEITAGGRAYGIRVRPGKGNVPQVKWVPDAFADVVREAVGRLRLACASARAVAAWYERNPRRLWLPDHLRHLRSAEWLLLPEVQAILGLPRLAAASLWIKENGVPHRLGERRGGNGKRLVEASFAGVERAVLDKLPKDFPHPNGIAGQRYSETLVVTHPNALHSDRATLPCMFEPVGYGQFHTWLAGSAGRQSVFDRHGFKERDGRGIQVGTHAFRHWLNTMAQKRGVGELDIAKWSGRHPDQNHFYDHESSLDILRELSNVIEDDERGHGPLFEAASSVRPDRKRPISRNDLRKTLFGSGHVTDVGICVHDYSLLPCQNHGNCLGCAENVFVKGDPTHRTKVESRLAATLEQLEQARAALEQSTYGADRWVRAHEKNVRQMRRMLAVHGDPAVRDGDLISLEALEQDSEIQMALRDRKAPPAEGRAACPTPHQDGAVLSDEIAEVFE